MNPWIALGCVGMLLLTSACSKQEEQKGAATPPATPAAQPVVPAVATAAQPAAPAVATAAQPVADPHAAMPHPAMPTTAAGAPPPPPAIPTLPSNGIVKQVIQAGTYTYLEVENGGNLYWLAGNHVEFKEGDAVRWGAFSPMRNFQSKTLNRVFPLVLFVGAIESANAPQTQAAPTNQGKVLQVIETAGYNYIEVETSSGKKWLAAPQGAVQQGQTVAWDGGTPMQNFSSKTLERTFDEILFVAASPTPVP